MAKKLPKQWEAHLGNGPTLPPEPVEPLDRQTLRKLEQKGRRQVEKKFNTLEALKIVYVPISSIYPNTYNPNRQSEREFELLKKSIEEDGFTVPIVVQQKTNQIVDGEHRWRALAQLGFTEIPVVYVDMTQAQAYVSTLRHNRARGSEDIELSMKILSDLREMGSLEQAIDSLHLDENTLNILLEDRPSPELMANESFSSAWIPTEARPNEEATRILKDREVHTSKAAMEQQERFETAISNAEGFIEAGEISKRAASEIERVTLTFKPNQKELIDTLRPNIDQSILWLCCKAAADCPELMEKMKKDIYWNVWMDMIEKVIAGTYGTISRTTE